jgi:predicted site-specific integrase-resolvase
MIDRLNTRDAAAFLRVTPRTMQRWRREGVGPAYLRMEGRIWYTTDHLNQYLASLEVSR